MSLSSLRVPGAQSPFTRQPIRWGAPPPNIGAKAIPPDANASDGASSFVILNSLGFSRRVTGLVGGPFPKLARVSSIGFKQPIALINISLACSISNTSATDVAMVAIHKDVGAVMSVDLGDNFLADHIVEQGLAHSIRTGTSFMDNIAPGFGTSDEIAIYAIMPDAACSFTAMVNLRYLTTA